MSPPFAPLVLSAGANLRHHFVTFALSDELATPRVEAVHRLIPRPIGPGASVVGPSCAATAPHVWNVPILATVAAPCLCSRAV